MNKKLSARARHVALLGLAALCFAANVFARKAENSDLTAPGVDGVSYTKTFTVKVDGNLHAFPNLLDNRRFRDPADHQ